MTFIARLCYFFSGSIPKDAFMPLAVMTGVMLMDYSEKLPFENRMSAIYPGAATFLGMMGIPSMAAQEYIMVDVAEV